jgi:outer membrane protein TolC
VRWTDPVQQIEAAANLKTVVDFQVSGEPVDLAGESAATLSVSEVIRRALQHDPNLQMSLARVRSALAEANQARLLPNPVLNVALRFPSGGGGKPAIEAGLAADLLAVLGQPRRSSAADNRLRSASADALTTALDLLAEAQERYIAAQALEAQRALLDERLGLVRRLLDLAKSRLAAGEAAQLDVLTFDAERVRIEAEIMQQEADSTDARLQLARLIGQPSAQAEWTLPRWTAPHSLWAGEARWIAAALEHRPEIKSAGWELAALGDEVALSRLSPFDGMTLGVDAERDDQWTIGPALSAPIPLMDFGQERAAKAEANRIEARHKFTRTRRLVIEDVRRAFTAMNASQHALNKVKAELIPLEQRRREQAEAQYKNGFADITAVLLAEQELKAAQVSQIELQQKVSLAEVRLERAVGGPAVIEQTQRNMPSTNPTTKAGN